MMIWVVVLVAVVVAAASAAAVVVVGVLRRPHFVCRSSWLLMSRIQRGEKKVRDDLFQCTRRPCVTLCLQLNRALDLSRNKHAFWQWRFASMSEKTQPSGAAPAPSSPPLPAVPSDRSSDSLKRGDNTHNVELLYAPNT